MLQSVPTLIAREGNIRHPMDAGMNVGVVYPAEYDPCLETTPPTPIGSRFQARSMPTPEDVHAAFRSGVAGAFAHVRDIASPVFNPQRVMRHSSPHDLNAFCPSDDRSIPASAMMNDIRSWRGQAIVVTKVTGCPASHHLPLLQVRIPDYHQDA